MMKKGLTLIELGIVIVLFVLLFTLVFEILVTGRSIWESGSTHLDIRTQARQGLEYMSRELFKTSPYQIWPKPFPDDSPDITFRVPVGYDIAGRIRWGADGTPEYDIRFRVDGNRQLVRQILDDTGAQVGLDRVLAKDVDSVGFTLINPILEINLTTQKSVVGRDLSHTLSSNIRLRN